MHLMLKKSNIWNFKTSKIVTFKTSGNSASILQTLIVWANTDSYQLTGGNRSFQVRRQRVENK